jgi:hypothetical protein
MGALVGEVHCGVFNAWDFAQSALDATCATGAGHAGNGQIERLGNGHRGHSWKVDASEDQPCHSGKVKNQLFTRPQSGIP